MVDAVEDRPIAVDLDPSEDVRVVPDDDVRAGVDRGPGKRALVLRELGAEEADAFVEGDAHDVDLPLQPCDVVLEIRERVVVR